MKRNSFTEEEMKAFEPAEKIALLACLNAEGLPHITLITSMMAPRVDQLTIGQFCEGLSKAFVQQNPRVAFLIMTRDRKVWRGRARWTHLRREGAEYERYNEIPMFRYNTYFGIHTVHFFEPVEISGPEPLPLPRIILGALATRAAKGAAKTGIGERILTPFAERLFNRLDTLKFLAYAGADGFPVLMPLLPCQAADSRRLAFAGRGGCGDSAGISAGTPVAVFCLTMQMEDVLVRGRFGRERHRGIPLATVDIDWVYNSMPPCHGQIYPMPGLEPVARF